MTHHHDHDHDHDHHHHHDHGHTHEAPAEMTVADKLAKLLDHWMKHNEEHASTYLTWAARAKENGLGEVEAQLKEAAEKTRSISGNFEAALAAVKKS